MANDEKDEGAPLTNTKLLDRYFDELKNTPVPEAGNEWEKLRHAKTSGDVDEWRSYFDLDDLVQAIERICASEGMSANGIKETQAAVGELISGAFAAGAISARRRDEVGKTIKAKIKSVAGMASGEVRRNKSEKEDAELWEQMKPHVMPQRNASENIRSIRKARIPPPNTSDRRLRRILDKHLYPPLRRLGQKNK